MTIPLESVRAAEVPMTPPGDPNGPNIWTVHDVPGGGNLYVSPGCPKAAADALIYYAAPDTDIGALPFLGIGKGEQGHVRSLSLPDSSEPSLALKSFFVNRPNESGLNGLRANHLVQAGLARTALQHPSLFARLRRLPLPEYEFSAPRQYAAVIASPGSNLRTLWLMSQEAGEHRVEADMPSNYLFTDAIHKALKKCGIRKPQDVVQRDINPNNTLFTAGAHDMPIKAVMIDMQATPILGAEYFK